jgi:cytochrome c oxidase cbb3-type subunit III
MALDARRRSIDFLHLFCRTPRTRVFEISTADISESRTIAARRRRPNMSTLDPRSPKGEAQLLDHEYDGIRELDNMLPRWWVWLLYGTIVFAAGYSVYYLSGFGPTPQQELAVSLKQIEALKPSPEASGAAATAAIVAVLGNPKNIHEGQEVFKARCVACHGDNAQGVIGPNLTDDFWINGQGRIQDIAQVVANGVPEKGMPPWGPILSDHEARDVVVYIRSLHATNPANAKAPQGDKYEFKE